jgi:hypothetical protein
LYVANPKGLYPADDGAVGAIQLGQSKPNKTEGVKYFEGDFEIKAAPLPPRVFKLRPNHSYNQAGYDYGGQKKVQYVKEYNRPKSQSENIKTTPDIFKMLGRHPSLATVMQLVQKDKYVSAIFSVNLHFVSVDVRSYILPPQFVRCGCQNSHTSTPRLVCDSWLVLHFRIRFDAVTGLDITYTAAITDTLENQAPLNIFAEDADAVSLQLSHRHTGPGVRNLSLRHLLHDAVGLDGDAMAEKVSLEEIQQLKEAAALRARPHFVKEYTGCSCTPFVGTGYGGRRKMQTQILAHKQHTNCVQANTCDLVSVSKTKLRDGYEWRWELTDGSYGLYLIDKTPLPEPEKSNAEQLTELAQKKNEADARKLIRENGIKTTRRQFYEMLFSNLKRDVGKPSVARLFDCTFTVVQKQSTGGATNGTFKLEVFLKPALFVSYAMEGSFAVVFKRACLKSLVSRPVMNVM